MTTIIITVMIAIIIVIIKPHRNTTYIDVAHCYRPSSVVCRSVCRSVCHTSESCKKTAEPIEMSFGLRTLVWAQGTMSGIADTLDH